MQACTYTPSSIARTTTLRLKLVLCSCDAENIRGNVRIPQLPTIRYITKGETDNFPWRVSEEQRFRVKTLPKGWSYVPAQDRYIIHLHVVSDKATTMTKHENFMGRTLWEISCIPAA